MRSLVSGRFSTWGGLPLRMRLVSASCRVSRCDVRERTTISSPRCSTELPLLGAGAVVVRIKED